MPDILIRGLELPEKKHVCISIDVRGEARLYDLLNDCYCDPEVYEVIKLPSHGDLIDRDVLKHKFCAHCDGYEYDTGACADGDQDCMDAKIIMNAPVVVPAERSGADA